jgi:hypothetical protein
MQFRILVSLLFFSVLAQAQEMYINTVSNINLTKIQTLSDGSYIGTDGASVAKFDANGNVAWSNKINANAFNLINKEIIETSSHDVVLVDEALDNASGAVSMAVIRMDGSGNIKWTNVFSKRGSTLVNGAFATADDGVLVCGGGCAADNFILKIDNAGNQVWLREYLNFGSTGTGSKVVQTSNGNIYVCGSATINTSNYLYFIGTNADGDVLFSKEYNGLQNSVINSMVATANGFVIGGNELNSTSNSSPRNFILGVSATGTLQFMKELQFQNTCHLNAISVSGDNLMAAFTAYDQTGSTSYAAYASYSTSGQMNWSKQISSNATNLQTPPAHNSFLSLCANGNNGFLFLGNNGSNYVCSFNSEISECYSTTASGAISADITSSASAFSVNNMDDTLFHTASLSFSYSAVAGTSEQVCGSDVPTGTTTVPTTAQIFSVYPNPTTNYVHIQLPGNVNGFDIQLISLSGIIVYAQHFNQSSQQVSLPSVSKGFYMVKVLDESGKQYTSRITIQ